MSKLRLGWSQYPSLFVGLGICIAVFPLENKGVGEHELRSGRQVAQEQENTLAGDPLWPPK